MKFLLITLSLIVFTLQEHPEAKLQFVDYVKHFNYPVETHYIKCDDGYILTYFRIQKKNTTIVKLGLKPVFIQHGLLDSSDTWVENDEWRAPALMLANRGYDVWLGNSRGNKHSLNHTKYNPHKDKEFWEFTFQDMADYDLPGGFRYIANQTQQKVSYIGHSQGTIQMFIALAKNNPTVQSLIDKFIAFGPVAYVNHHSSELLTFLERSDVLEFFQRYHIYNVLPANWLDSEIGGLFCAEFPHVCIDTMKYLMDADPSLDNYERSDVFIAHDPAGTSLQNMFHLKQIVDSGRFQAYDFGSFALNTAHYGQPTPPIWKLENIRVPVRLIAGLSDMLADPTDVEHLWSELNPSVKTFYKAYNSGHATFLIGLNVDPWMNDVFRFLEN